MFENHTVFILGAGASWHYGYPTGEGLVKKVIDAAKEARVFFDRSRRHGPNFYLPDYVISLSTDHSILFNTPSKVIPLWHQAQEDCQKLIDSLQQVNPPVIDYFLGHNPELQKIGKLMIAWVICNCEKTNKEMNGKNMNRDSSDVPHKDDWVRFVLYQLASGCRKATDLFENKVKFITFNYDTSLENRLYGGLNSIELFNREENIVKEFLSGERITHVYGSIIQDNYNKHISVPDIKHQDNTQYQITYKAFLDHIYKASQGILAISDDKNLNTSLFARASTYISSANVVYILGYGFDETNSKRLELDKFLRMGIYKGRCVLFTNFKNSNRINKKASKLLFGNYNSFLREGQAIQGNPQGNFYCEKSIRDSYEALELDFDSLESQFLSSTTF